MIIGGQGVDPKVITEWDKELWNAKDEWYDIWTLSYHIVIAAWELSKYILSHQYLEYSLNIFNCNLYKLGETTGFIYQGFSLTIIHSISSRIYHHGTDFCGKQN